MNVLATLATVPFKHGFILDRWSGVTQVMMKKKAEPFADKLRIIELFEGDYAAMNKAIMRNVMQHLIQQKQSTLGTFVTEKGGTTHGAILSRVWAYDLVRSQGNLSLHSTTIKHDTMIALYQL